MNPARETCFGRLNFPKLENDSFTQWRRSSYAELAHPVRVGSLLAPDCVHPSRITFPKLKRAARNSGFIFKACFLFSPPVPSDHLGEFAVGEQSINRRLQRVAAQIQALCDENDLAGAFVLATSDQAVFRTRFDASWSGAHYLDEAGGVVALHFEEQDYARINATMHLATVLAEVGNYIAEGGRRMLSIMKLHTKKVNHPEASDVPDEKLPNAGFARDYLSSLTGRKEKKDG